MSIHRKLMTACCAAVLAFGLAACGSSDDDTAATDTDTPTVTEPTGPTQAKLDAEKMRADEAAAALAAAEAKAEAAKLRQLRTALTNFMKPRGTDPAAGDAVANEHYIAAGLPMARVRGSSAFRPTVTVMATPEEKPATA